MPVTPPQPRKWLLLVFTEMQSLRGELEKIHKQLQAGPHLSSTFELHGAEGRKQEDNLLFCARHSVGAVEEDKLKLARFYI